MIYVHSPLWRPEWISMSFCEWHKDESYWLGCRKTHWEEKVRGAQTSVNWQSVTHLFRQCENCATFVPLLKNMQRPSKPFRKKFGYKYCGYAPVGFFCTLTMRSEYVSTLKLQNGFFSNMGTLHFEFACAERSSTNSEHDSCARFGLIHAKSLNHMVLEYVRCGAKTFHFLLEGIARPTTLLAMCVIAHSFSSPQPDFGFNSINKVIFHDNSLSNVEKKKLIFANYNGRRLLKWKRTPHRDVFGFPIIYKLFGYWLLLYNNACKNESFLILPRTVEKILDNTVTFEIALSDTNICTTSVPRVSSISSKEEASSHIAIFDKQENITISQLRGIIFSLTAGLVLVNCLANFVERLLFITLHPVLPV